MWPECPNCVSGILRVRLSRLFAVPRARQSRKEGVQRHARDRQANDLKKEQKKKRNRKQKANNRRPNWRVNGHILFLFHTSLALSTKQARAQKERSLQMCCHTASYSPCRKLWPGTRTGKRAKNDKDKVTNNAIIIDRASFAPCLHPTFLSLLLSLCPPLLLLIVLFCRLPMAAVSSGAPPWLAGFLAALASGDAARRSTPSSVLAGRREPPPGTAAAAVALSLRAQHAAHAAARTRAVETHRAAAARAVGSAAAWEVAQARLRAAEAAAQVSSDLEMGGSMWSPQTLLQHLPLHMLHAAVLPTARVGSALQRRLRGGVRRALSGLGAVAKGDTAETAPATAALHASTRPASGSAAVAAPLLAPTRDSSTGSKPEDATGLAELWGLGPTEADVRVALDAVVGATAAAAGGTLRTEQTMRVPGLPISRADYILRDASGRMVGVLEAKRRELLAAFAQCVCQLLAMQALATDPRQPLVGVLSDGHRYAFLLLSGSRLAVHGPTVLAATTWNELYGIAGILLACMGGNEGRGPETSPGAKGLGSNSNSGSDRVGDGGARGARKSSMLTIAEADDNSAVQVTSATGEAEKDDTSDTPPAVRRSEASAATARNVSNASTSMQLTKAPRPVPRGPMQPLLRFGSLTTDVRSPCRVCFSGWSWHRMWDLGSKQDSNGTHTLSNHK